MYLYQSDRNRPTSDAIVPTDLPALNERVQVIINVLSEIETAAGWLKEQPGVEAMLTNGQSIRCEFPADPQAHADLLEGMIRSGIRVSSFSSKQRSLEDAFLHVTKGRIQ